MSHKNPAYVSKPVRVRVLIAACAFFICLTGARSSYAATFIVTRSDDRNNPTCVVGDCSLREAVTAANAAASDDVITFAAGLTSIVLGGEISIVNAASGGTLSINGPGANVLAIDGGAGTNRIFHSLGIVTITDLTFTGGNGDGINPDDSGGAIYVGGGLITLERLHFTGNVTSIGAAVYFGAGVGHRIRNSTVSGNQGGSCGGAFYVDTSLTIVNSTISNNLAARGGAMCIFFGNVSLRNSTITNNTANVDEGGAVWTLGGSGMMNFANTIIAGNSAVGKQEIRVGTAGNVTSLDNNLVGDSPGDSADTGNPIVYQPSDILDTPPLLEGLQNNGGTTPTRALLTGSPTLNAGNNAQAVDPSNGNAALTTDQRGTGFARIANGTVDIGAFERAFVANADLIAVTDPSVGVAAITGQNASLLAVEGTTLGANNYPAGQSADKAIDGVVATKYLNFQETNCGLIVTAQANGPEAVVNFLQFLTAEDRPDRDPITITLEGTNDLNATTTLNSNWTLLYNGPSGLATDPGRNALGSQVVIGNANPYRTYRLLVTTVRNGVTAESMQFSEIKLIGSTVTHTFTVNHLGDISDASPGNGICADGSGNCTLRAAAEETNALGGGTGPFVINFSVNGAIDFTSVSSDGGSALFLNSNTAIIGPGANLLTLRRSSAGGTPLMRIISFAPGTTQSISGVTISGGSMVTGDTGGGGGIITQGTVTVRGCVISNNRSGDGAANTTAASGGGIRNLGALLLFDSTVSGNRTGDGGDGTSSTAAGLGGFGGGIGNSGTATIFNSTISGNRAGDGGESTFIAGQGGHGGGIANFSNLTIIGSTVTKNQTGLGGVGNSSGPGGGTTQSAAGQFNVRNTIIAGNTSNGGASPDANSTHNSQGYNLIGNADGSSGFGATGDQLGNGGSPIDPVLGLLQNNGSTTPTHRLLPGSPAIDKGSSIQSAKDQRGMARPFDNPAITPASGGDDADIGAVEIRAILQTGSPSLIVNNGGDSGDGDCTSLECTLREALAAANGRPGADTITFGDPSFGGGPTVIDLDELQVDGDNNSALYITSDVTITGPGAGLLTIRRSPVVGTPNFRLFRNLSGVSTNISGVTLSDGFLPNFDAGAVGGAIYNDGTLNVSSLILTANHAQIAGGAFMNVIGGTLSVNNCTFTGNTAGSGGGGVSSSGTLGVTNSNFNNNTASFGGGLSLGGTATLDNVTITGNSALGSDGGGIYRGGPSGGTVTINNSRITGNSAPSRGGGLYNSASTPTVVTNSTFSGNTSFTGGAINRETGTMSVTNSTISGNSSFARGGGITSFFPGTITLISVTVTNNRSDSDNSGGSNNDGGGIHTSLPNSDVVHNSIVAGNFMGTGTTANDVAGNGTFNGASSFNLIGTGGSGGLADGSNNNQVGVANPGLGLLTNNGGTTDTHALLAGSPATDKGSAFGLVTDQRGQSRPVDLATPNAPGGDGSDIGAYEAQTPTAANVSVGGRVLTPNGRGLRNAVVTLTDQQGVRRITLSSSFGYYRFDDVRTGEIYVIGVKSRIYQFSPQAVTVNFELTDVDFIAESGMRYEP